MSGSLLLIEQRQARGYYAGLIRTTCVAHIERSGGKFPWENESWQRNMPELSAFLCNTETEFKGSEQEYAQLIQQFSSLASENKWLNKYLHEFAGKEQTRYLPPKPLNKMKIGIGTLVFAVGLAVGSVLF